MKTLARMAATVSGFGYGIATAFAGFGGPTPDIPGTPAGGGTAVVRTAVTAILVTILNLLALVAVIVIVIAGVRLIISGGNDEAKEGAKKTILYAVIGLLVVLFARVIVGFITTIVP